MLALALSPAAWSTDLKVTSVKVTYKDRETTPGRTVIRELKSFQDDSVSSKPSKVDISVRVKNIGTTSALFVVVVAEMYTLVDGASGSKFPPLGGIKLRSEHGLARAAELKTISSEPVWTWNRRWDDRPIRELKAGEEVSVDFKDVSIAIDYQPVDYQLRGIAVRVFADLRDKDDSDYSNNVIDSVVMYTQ